MSIESIQFHLLERFAAPLPEFYRRRIIFWQDEEAEFAGLIDELRLPSVRIVKLNGSNNFAIKKLLSHDDVDSNFLVYNPIAYADVQDDWLLDIELYSEEYRADLLSIQMQALSIDNTPHMRKATRLYAKFLDNKERRQKLKRIGRMYQAPLQLHIDIMAVLAGLNGGTSQDVLIAVLAAGLDKDTNPALQGIERFGNIDAFWQMVRKYTGYIDAPDKQLSGLATHILLTALSQTMEGAALKGLERFISESNRAYCYTLVHEWRGREDAPALYDLCRVVEGELHLPARFDKQEIEALLTSDICPAIHESILKRLYAEIAQHVVKPELIAQVVENRRISGWYDHFADYYECLHAIGLMQGFYQEYGSAFHVVEAKQIWKQYTGCWYQMDAHYRHFHHAFLQSLKHANPLLEDGLKHATGFVEGLYQNWYLEKLNACWAGAIAENLEALGYVSEIDKQRDFYRKHVQGSGKGSRVFVIISDALRYEVAEELTALLPRVTKGNAALSAMQAVFPSITKFGMAALLPGRELSVTQTIDVLVDGLPTKTTADREKILRAAQPDSVAIQYKELLLMKKQERRDLVAGKDVVYIYHNAIDAIGDKAPTENKVFEACRTAMDELVGMVRIITGELSGATVLITADHGFLYTYSPLAESDKIGKNAFNGDVYELGRRYALTSPDTSAEYLLPVQMDKEIGGTPVKGYAPCDAIRIKVQGGGANFVHGGISLQEMVVPVIAYKNVRATSKAYVEVQNAQIKLLSENRKISNLIFSLDFYQQQPIGEKIQPASYALYFTDGEGMVISDRLTVIADKVSENAAERGFRVRFNLKSAAYDKDRIYRLVIAGGTDMPEEIEFRIDIAFADDFGFDL